MLEFTAFVPLLRSCARDKELHTGARLHREIIERGLVESFADVLVIMYAKCAALAEAQQLVDMYKSRNIACWNVLILGYVQEGRDQNALECFEKMQEKGVFPNAITLSCILKVCGTIGASAIGEQIHTTIARQGLLGANTVLGTALVDMYAKCGALGRAQQVHEQLPVRDVVCWSALISGYAQHAQGGHALSCFECMEYEGLLPDAVAFASTLKACCSIGAADKGRQFHNEIVRRGLLRRNVILGNVLVDMYAKFGDFLKAQQVLEELPVQNVASWNALIAAYAQQGQGEQALNCFESMRCKGLSPDLVTYLCILKACGTIESSKRRAQIHDEIARQGLLRSNIVLGTALVDMYSKCAALTKAQQVLEELPVRDVVSWSALIAGCAQLEQGDQALNYFEKMQQEGLHPNAIIFSSILKACGSIGASEKGAQIHDRICKLGLLRNNIVLGNALVDMYAKCGALEKAYQVLEELPARDVVAWNSLILGYVEHGQSMQVRDCFERMQQEHLLPDAVTFACFLKGCGSTCLVEDAQMLFWNMSINYGIKPDLTHYTSMVDVFGRAGYLGMAIQLIKRMPSCAHSSALWSALLGASQKWGDLLVGRWAFEHGTKFGGL